MPDTLSPAHISEQFIKLFAAGLPEDAPTPPGCFRSITGQPHPLGNLLCLDHAIDPKTAADLAKPLCRDDCPSAVIFTGDNPPAQHEAITPLGFAPAETMQLMSVQPQDLAQTTLPDGYRFKEVSSDDAPRWCDAFIDGYEVPPSLAVLFAPGELNLTEDQGTVRYFAAEHNGEFAAVSLVYLTGNIAGIYCVATRSEHRRRGLGAHLTAEPLRLVMAESGSTGILQSSEMGEPIYRRLGFRSVGHMDLVVRLPG